MLDMLKGILAKRETTSAQQKPVANPVGAANAVPPIVRAGPSAPRAAAAKPKDVDDQPTKLKTISVPVIAITPALPDSLVSTVQSENGEIEISLKTIMDQLPTGKVVMKFRELVSGSPTGTFAASAAQLAKEITLPLDPILAKIPIEELRTRPNQVKPQLPEEARGIYTQKGDTLFLSRSALIQPSRSGGAASRGDTEFIRASNGAPPVVSTRPPKPEADPNLIVLGLASLANNWPEPIREEIAARQWTRSAVGIPIVKIEPGLRAGNVSMKWGDVIDCLIPPVTGFQSNFASITVAFPLPIITPLFLAKLRTATSLRQQQPTAPEPETPSAESGHTLRISKVEVEQSQPVSPAPEPEPAPTDSSESNSELPVPPEAPGEERLVPRISGDMPLLRLVTDLEQASPAPAEEASPAAEPLVASDSSTAPETAPALDLTTETASLAESPSNGSLPTELPAVEEAKSPAETNTANRRRRPGLKGITELPSVGNSKSQCRLDWPFHSAEPVGDTSFLTAPKNERRTFENLVREAASLPGVAGASITTDDGQLMASQFSSETPAGKSAAFFCLIYGKIHQFSHDISLGELGEARLYFDEIPWFICRAGQLLFIAQGKPYEPMPDAQLRALVVELSHLPVPLVYGDHQSGIQGTETQNRVLRPAPWWENDKSGTDS